MKMDKTTLMTALKILEMTDGSYEVPNCFMSAIYHVKVKSEILKEIEATFPDKVITKDRIKTIAKSLNRSTQQVSYYVSELEYDKIITRPFENVGHKSIATGNKIAKYMIANNLDKVNIYDLAEAIDCTVSEIHGCLRRITTLGKTEQGYDERGRKIYIIYWFPEDKEDFLTYEKVRMY